jgi:NAD+ synthase (glutamine-hydrolysing)
MAYLYQALVLGIRDYLRKCGFRDVLVGVSGGIDSAVVATLAADALGPDHVIGVFMPSRFTSPESVEDATTLARNLGIRWHVIPIDDIFEAFLARLHRVYEPPGGVAEENLQARIRGTLLMTLSNRWGALVLSTGNKSELALGYCTLYGDMTGGLAVLGDVPKMMVYELARFLNREKERIPARIFTKPPSAELRPGQRDEDDIPPYRIVDQIIRLYVEEEMSVPEIVAQGFDPETVRQVVLRIDRNEYKRRQAPPVLKVTSRAFGSGRRMPIAQRFRHETPAS